MNYFDFDFTPITELNEETVKGLIIHATRSSIRRAAAVKPMITIPADEAGKLPTLHYVVEAVKEVVDLKSGETKKVATCSVHALSSEVTKYLLYKSIGETSGEENTENTGN